MAQDENSRQGFTGEDIGQQRGGSSKGGRATGGQNEGAERSNDPQGSDRINQQDIGADMEDLGE